MESLNPTNTSHGEQLSNNRDKSKELGVWWKYWIEGEQFSTDSVRLVSCINLGKNLPFLAWLPEDTYSIGNNISTISLWGLRALTIYKFCQLFVFPLFSPESPDKGAEKGLGRRIELIVKSDVIPCIYECFPKNQSQFLSAVLAGHYVMMFIFKCYHWYKERKDICQNEDIYLNKILSGKIDGFINNLEKAETDLTKYSRELKSFLLRDVSHFKFRARVDNIEETIEKIQSLGLPNSHEKLQQSIEMLKAEIAVVAVSFRNSEAHMKGKLVAVEGDFHNLEAYMKGNFAAVEGSFHKLESVFNVEQFIQKYRIIFSDDITETVVTIAQAKDDLEKKGSLLDRTKEKQKNRGSLSSPGGKTYEIEKIAEDIMEIEEYIKNKTKAIAHKEADKEEKIKRRYTVLKEFYEELQKALSYTSKSQLATQSVSISGQVAPNQPSSLDIFERQLLALKADKEELAKRLEAAGRMLGEQLVALKKDEEGLAKELAAVKQTLEKQKAGEAELARRLKTSKSELKKELLALKADLDLDFFSNWDMLMLVPSVRSIIKCIELIKTGPLFTRSIEVMEACSFEEMGVFVLTLKFFHRFIKNVSVATNHP